MTVIDKDFGWKRIQEEVRKAHNLEVAVGVLQGSTNQDGASIAEYGAYNEYGTANIPSRPFMATTVDENQAAIKSAIARRYNSMLSGTLTADQALLSLGLWMSGKIKNTIQKRNFLPKLADITIKAKKGSTKTLVDTGALINSISQVVRKRGT